LKDATNRRNLAAELLLGRASVTLYATSSVRIDAGRKSLHTLAHFAAERLKLSGVDEAITV
jgi:hypothetical protein